MDKEKAIKKIEEKKDLIIDTADKIWEYAELSLQEKKSCKLYCRILEEEGFVVDKGISGITTAFSASFGKGRPVIGILAEYDALSGLSQERFSAVRKPLETGGNGHGCGHNLLGAGAMAAALGIKEYLSGSGKEGTVILYGCPGEEGWASKAFMAKDRVWEKLDAALTWHPYDKNEVVTGSSNACIQVKYTFKGIASHASGAPEKGRSALDAVELMNIGVQFLREHMDSSARVHYAITDAGGVSPNVVQPRAEVLYMVRSPKVKDALVLQKRVDKIAEGAALMTETQFDRELIDGLSEIVPNNTLEKLLYENYKALGTPEFSKEELEFAGKLHKTYGNNEGSMSLTLKDLSGEERFEATSTDVGDVSWLTPTAQIHVAAWPEDCPGHSWQNVSSAGSSLGHKAALHAGKVLSAAAIDLMENSDILKKAREEFIKRTEGGYHCPVE